MAELIKKTDNLNQGREKLNAAITDAEKAKSTAGQAVSTSNDAKQIAQTAEDKADSVQTQLDTIVIEGDSSVEAAQARVDEKGESHETLKARIDDGFTTVTSQKVKIDDRAFYEGVKMNRRHKAIMSIIDDDGYPQVYEMLKPIVESEGIPITTAVITSRVGTSDLSMNLAQLKECQEAGMEVQSHTYSHKPLATLSYEEQEFEIAESKRWLQMNNFGSEVIVYPFGSTNADTYELTDRYYSAGVYIDSGNSLLNDPPVMRYRLQRVYYNLTQPVTEGDKNRIQHCKDKIDEAIANDSWIIIGLHCFYEGFNPEGLREVIQYAKSKGIEIVTMKRGLELYGNIIDLPDFQVGADGNIHSSKIGHFVKMINAATATTPLSEFPSDAISYRSYNNSSASSSDMPEKSQGTLFNFRGASDNYGNQFYVLSGTNRIYTQQWNNTTKTWSGFTLMNSRNVVKPGTFRVGDVQALGSVEFSFSGSPLNSSQWGVSVTPTSTPPSGIIIFGYLDENGVLKVRITNITSSSINCGDMSFNGLLVSPT